MEKFKIGDWVIGIEGKFSENSIWYTAFQIDKITVNNREPGTYYIYNSKGNNNSNYNFRKAHDYEIPGYKSTVTNYEYLIPLLKKLNIK